MTTRSRWRDWTPPRRDDPPQPTEGAFVSFDGASRIRSPNANQRCPLGIKVARGVSYFHKTLRENPPKPTKATGVDHDAIHLALTVDAGTADDLAAIGRHVARDGFWVAEELTWLDRRCDRLSRDGVDEATYRAAVLLLVARIDELHRQAEGTAPISGPRRLTMAVNAPVVAPMLLSDGTVIENVSGFLARLLTAIDYVLGRSVTGETAVLEISLGQLASLGIAARVEVVP